jgi:hypothetical protein
MFRFWAKRANSSFQEMRVIEKETSLGKALRLLLAVGEPVCPARQPIAIWANFRNSD